MMAVSGEMLSACFFQRKRNIGNNSLACQKQLKEGRNPSSLVNKILFIQRRSTQLRLWLFLHENSHRKIQDFFFLRIYFSSVGLQGLKWGHELLGSLWGFVNRVKLLWLKRKIHLLWQVTWGGSRIDLGSGTGTVSAFCISTVSSKIL